jgi:hypothetical protein
LIAAARAWIGAITKRTEDMTTHDDVIDSIVKRSEARPLSDTGAFLEEAAGVAEKVLSVARNYHRQRYATPEQQLAGIPKMQAALEKAAASVRKMDAELKACLAEAQEG